MRTKAIIITASALSVFLFSCQQKEEQTVLRSEYIQVYDNDAPKPVDNIQIPFDGVQDGKIHVLSNVDLEWRYFVNQTTPGNDWLTIKSVELEAPGHLVVTYDAASILALNSLERREGHLTFSCPDVSLGKFLPVRQGYQNQFLEEFSDFEGGCLTITGNETFTTEKYPVLNLDYFDYIAFNAWATTDNPFLGKNITLDVTVSGGKFYDTGLFTYRVNVPLGLGADKSNLKYLLVVGNGKHMSPDTQFTFSVANDDRVYVHIDNFAAYKVTEAEMGELFEDEEFDDEGEEGGDWI